MASYIWDVPPSWAAPTAGQTTHGEVKVSNVTVTCDRCKQPIDGAEYGSDEVKLGFTSGFYRITEDGKGWGKYTNPGERIICDACMWRDARYQADYGAAAAQSLDAPG